jgi:hypothetical protein
MLKYNARVPRSNDKDIKKCYRNKMIISMYSDRLSAVLPGLKPNEEGEGFQFERMGDNPQTLPPRNPDQARLIYGICPTPAGGLSEELLTTPPFGPKAFTSDEVTPLINQGLAEMAKVKESTPLPIRLLRSQAVETCVERGYEVVAGLLVYRSTEGEPVHLSFHARPLGEAVFTLRDETLGLSPEADEAQQGVLGVPAIAKEQLRHPDWATVQYTGQQLGSLLLPAAMQQLIEPYR